MSQRPVINPVSSLTDADPLRSVHTSNLPALFAQLGISLVVSTYQAGKAIVVRNDNGALNTHFRTFTKPMGIAADSNRLTIGGANTVWEYRNMPAVAQKLEPAGNTTPATFRAAFTSPVTSTSTSLPGTVIMNCGPSTPGSVASARLTPTIVSLPAGGRRLSVHWLLRIAAT